METSMAMKEIDTELGGHPAKIFVGSSDFSKRANKVTAVKIALTYVEVTRKKVTPKEVMAIADEFLGWLEKL